MKTTPHPCGWLVGWLVLRWCVPSFVCAFVSAFVCSFRGLFACVLSWVEIYDGTVVLLPCTRSYEYLFLQLHDCCDVTRGVARWMCPPRARATHTHTLTRTRSGLLHAHRGHARRALSRRRANRQTRTNWARRSLDATYSLLNATLIKKKAQPTCQKTPARRSHMT